MKRYWSVLLAFLLGCVLIAPTSAAAAAGDPFGNFERASVVDGGIEVKGWAIDPDTASPIFVWVTLDGAGRHLFANRSRPDVALAYPDAGPNHGFAGTLAAEPGAHRVCVTASNVGPGSHRSLACRDVTVPDDSPFGNVERATGVVGGIELKGWAIDPNTASPIYVWVTLDGAGRHLFANRSRPDVAVAHPDAGPNHGFATTLAAAAGAHRVCVTAANVGPGSHRSLGCHIVTVPDASPFGNFEGARSVLGGIEVKGWAIDPDTTAPIYLWVTVDGAGVHLSANRVRPDVATRYPASGPNHGFVGTVDASPGMHRVCVTASNVGPGSHRSLGCRDVRFPEAIAVGAEPRDILVVPDQGRAFVANATDGTVSVIDTATKTVIDTIDAGDRPAWLAHDPLTGLLYVSNAGEGFGGPPPVLVIIDPATLDVIDTIDDVGGPIFIDPAAERAYTTGEGNPGEELLTVFDTAAREVIATEAFPGPWFGAVLDPDADLLYVGIFSTGRLLVIDLATMAVTDEIDTDFADSDAPLLPVALDQDAGVLYVSELEGPLHVIDTATLEPITSIPTGSGADATVLDVVLDGARGLAYVLKVRAGEVDVVETDSYAVIDTVDVGGDGAAEAGAVNSTTGTLYVVDGSADAVLVLARPSG